jgi:hypothetical protein
MAALDDYILNGDAAAGAEPARGGGRSLLREIQHVCKYGDAPARAREVDSLRVRVDALSGEAFFRACVAATCVQHLTATYHRYVPGWAKDRRLRLDPPWFGAGVGEDGVLFAPQACIDHNVFIDRASLDVL